MRSAAGRTLFILLRAAVTVGVLWVVLRYYGIERMLAIASHLDPVWLAAALLLAVAQVVLMAWRWQLLCSVLTGASPRFRTLLLGLARSLLLGQLLPATVGADAVRATALARAVGAGGAVRSVVADRLLALLALLLLVAGELPFLARIAAPGPALASLAALSAAGIAGFAAVLALRPVVARLPVLGRLANILAEDLWRALARPQGRLALLAAAATHLLSILLFLALLRSVNSAAPLAAGALVILPVLLVISVPLSLGGWGLREAAVVSGFALLGADPVPGLTASILFGLSGPISGAIVEVAGLMAHTNDLVSRRRTGSANGG